MVEKKNSTGLCDESKVSAPRVFQTMNVKYFRDTDTALLEFSQSLVSTKVLSAIAVDFFATDFHG